GGTAGCTTAGCTACRPAGWLVVITTAGHEECSGGSSGTGCSDGSPPSNAAPEYLGPVARFHCSSPIPICLRFLPEMKSAGGEPALSFASRGPPKRPKGSAFLQSPSVSPLCQRSLRVVQPPFVVVGGD